MTEDRSAPTVERDSLVLARRLGQGGQGTVHEVADRPGVVYKEYRPETLPELDSDALTAIVALLAALDGAEARRLRDRAAWPTAVVRQRGRTCGFLMRAAPERFHFDLHALGGATVATRRLATLEFLLNDDGYVAGVGLTVSDRDRLELLADLAGTLSRLHRLGIAVGDLSPKNLLFATGAGDGGRATCFLIDCDAVRLRGATVLPQVETPDWQLPPGEERGTAAGDAYKLALLAVRLFARDQNAVDPAALAALSPALGDLARAGLDPDPARRPAPALWAEHLTAAAATADTAPAVAPVVPLSPPPAASPVTPVPVRTPPVRTPPTRTPPAAVGVGIAAVVAAVVLAVVLGVNHNRSDSSSDSGPSYTPPPVSTPTSTPTRTYPPTPRPSPTPLFDPDSLDDERTDHTPLTATALLPEAFTDSNQVRYERASGGRHECAPSGVSEHVRSVLSTGGCVNQVVGTYLDATSKIMVIVLVKPLRDARTADAAYTALSDTDISDWDFWCPNSGPGSELCADGANTTRATQSGRKTTTHRYLIHAQAIYVNLGRDDTFEPWTDAATRAALKAAGPRNYW
ncbi:hypothetical protein [Kitasatospora brasiliensis]|uniref:hypothetical protein n=1 Tax=Kitasatospora brasiliensis TaxID=3058040 RepID=UPI0029307671|nr:hypothetical protein [Kitasatospora sp. K002]